MATPTARASESEADAIGIQLLARACYDPDANVRMLQRLEAQERAQGGGGRQGPVAKMISTHPLTEDRVARVRAALPKAYETYQVHCSHRHVVFDELARVFG